jgi:predicted nucleotidyltransferase component of viral defense system
MLSETLLHYISDTSELLGLEKTFVEKDYYVTQIIHSLSNVENEHFQLIFCGGTCLAKAHKLVNRMSEDIDFKIRLKNNEIFSRSRLNKELKKFREKIKSTLPKLSFIEDVARNEGKYQRIILKYPYSFPASQTLRPDIMLEFTFSDIRLAINKLEIKTLIENTLENVNLFTPLPTNCLSVEETAIEKWVGLTRRIIAIERGYEADDKTLIRHVYDLNAIYHINKVNSNFIELVKTVVNGDIKQFKNQHPEYAAAPASEIKKSLALLKKKLLWKNRYEEFIEAMVYDNAGITPYNKAVATLENISSSVIDKL